MPAGDRVTCRTAKTDRGIPSREPSHCRGVMDRSSGLSGETKRSAAPVCGVGRSLPPFAWDGSRIVPGSSSQKEPPALGAGVFDLKGDSVVRLARRLTLLALCASEVPRPGSVTGADLTVRPVGSRGGEGGIEGGSNGSAGNVSLSLIENPTDVALPSQNILIRVSGPLPPKGSCIDAVARLASREDGSSLQ